MAVNPKNRYNVWLGTAGGGIWITNNRHIGGVTTDSFKPDPADANFDRDWQPQWTPHNRGFTSLAIGAIVLDESRCFDSGCLRAYVGTGENSLRRDTYYGDGVYLVEYGDSEFPQWNWFRLDTDQQFRYGSTAGLVIDDGELFVALSPGNTTTSAYATVRAPEPVAGFGVHRRSKSGVWTRIFATTSHGKERWSDLLVPTDLEQDPSNPDSLFLGVMNDGIFRTTDRGKTWCALNPGSRLLAASQDGEIPTKITNCSTETGLPTAGSFDHVEIALESENRLYAMFGNCPSDYSAGSQRATWLCEREGNALHPFFYRSTDGGKSWLQPGLISGGHYSRYTHALEAVGGEQVLWGGLGPYLLRTAESNFSKTYLGRNSVHFDMHDLHGLAGWDHGAGVVYAATDGGFYFRPLGSPAADWVQGNDSLITTAFCNIAIDYEDEPGDGMPRTTAILGGLQDNSNAAYNGSEKWQLWGPVGDGGEAVIQTPTVTYDSVDHNGIRRIPGFDGFSSSVSGPHEGKLEENVSFYSLIAQHEETKRFFVGTDVVSVIDGSAAAWDAATRDERPHAQVISPPLGSDGHDFPAIETDRDLITALAVAPSHGWRLYVGLYSGQVWRSTTGPSERPIDSFSDWTRLDGGSDPLPDGTISSIAVHPLDEDRVWVAFSDFLPKNVWYSQDAGATWEPRSSGLPPNEPVNVIKVVPDSPNRLWVGTDKATYLSNDGGSTWEPRTANLPRSPVFDIEIDRHTNRIFAATHGRGVWMLTDQGPLLTTFEGWTEDGIWDIPIYGTGFSCLDPDGCDCTVDVEREDGSVCASGSSDARGNRIYIAEGGHTLRTADQVTCTRCEGKPVALACFNGDCVGGVDLESCNADGHSVSAVRVRCEENPEATGSVAGFCPEQPNPPSDLFTVSPPLTVPTRAASRSAGTKVARTKRIHATPTILASPGNGGDRALCSVDVALDPDNIPGSQLDLRDAINAEPSCQFAGVTASVVQEMPLEGEDSPEEADRRLALSTPGITGSQLLLGIAAAPGDAEGLCFNSSRLGVYLANQVVATQMRFPTSRRGAAGGELILSEISPVGYCTMRVPTRRGQTAEQIAKAVVNAFQDPEVLSPHGCPESNNPGDLVLDGDSVVAVLPTSFQACIMDPGVGFSFGPHGVEVRPPSIRDCNINGIDDAADIDSGASQDINSDGIPDECQIRKIPCIFSGSAQGGQVSVTLGGLTGQCTVHIMTSPGDSAMTIATNLAAAINADACMSGQGITASPSGRSVYMQGLLLRFLGSTVTDPGIRHRLPVVAIPTLRPTGLLLMATLLLLAAMLKLLKSRRTPGSSSNP